MASPLTHTTLADLIKKLLKSLDSYNSTDLTLSTPNADSDSLGERARLCLNQALHMIYSLIKDSRYLEAYPTTNLSTTANQDYVDLDPEAYLDDIDAITETTNDRKLIRKSWSWYRRNYPDPSQVSGEPLYYIRRGNRVYLAPRPSSAIPLTIDFRKLTDDLKLNGDISLLPTRYDYWIIAEAKVIWFEMEDPTAVPALIIAERDNKRQIGMESVVDTHDTILQSRSHFDSSDDPGILPYERPDGTTG